MLQCSLPAGAQAFVAASRSPDARRSWHGDGPSAVAARPRRQRQQPAAASAAGAAGAAAAPAVPAAPEIVGTKNVVVLGGTGRVGSSAAAALAAAAPGARISLAGRSGEEAFRAAVARRPELSAAKPLRCDVDDPASLAAALKGADLVIHAAGPFQRRGDCAVLEAAIAAGEARGLQVPRSVRAGVQMRLVLAGVGAAAGAACGLPLPGPCPQRRACAWPPGPRRRALHGCL